jgi:AcrR family transcriptional regulator
MPQIAVRTVDPVKPVLGRHAWLTVALTMLAREGIDAVQITRLARKLNATRGSFYWHFKDREDLLNCIIEEWQAANSGIIAETLDRATSLTEGVLSLFYVWVNDEQFSPHLDQAIRDWARHDTTIRQVVRCEEDNRVAAIAAFFGKHDYGKDDAFVRARVLYFTQAGYYALNIEESMTARLSLTDSYYRTFTGREIDTEQAAAFRKRMEQGETP